MEQRVDQQRKGIGRVVGIHIRDDIITSEGKLDVLKIRPLARLG
jgi:hypothetical protein